MIGLIFLHDKADGHLILPEHTFNKSLNFSVTYIYPLPDECTFLVRNYILKLFREKTHTKQVAQRATIAHLSPMCQGQISFQKTYKWAMETRGPKSNSSELLCLSKMNELAWRHHFPIISIWEIFKTSRAANSIVSGPIWLKFELVRDFMHVLVTCKYKKDWIKNNREKVETSFSPL